MALSDLQRSIIRELLVHADARIVRHSQFTPIYPAKAGKSEVLIPNRPPWAIPGYVTSKLLRNGLLEVDTKTDRYTTLLLSDIGRTTAAASSNPVNRRSTKK